MGWDLSIPVPSRICKWDEKTSQSRPYIFFGTKICLNPVPKEMGSCGIPSQLEKFTFLISNETRWDEIYQSHSRPAYIIGIKKYPNPVPNFLWDKNMSQSRPKWDGIPQDPIPSGKIVIPRHFVKFM